VHPDTLQHRPTAHQSHRHLHTAAADRPPLDWRKLSGTICALFSRSPVYCQHAYAVGQLQWYVKSKVLSSGPSRRHLPAIASSLCSCPLQDYSGTAKAAGSAIHVRDPRLDIAKDLIPGLFTAKNCLDIGCNAGGVSCQLGKQPLHPCSLPASDYTTPISILTTS
jgi:hypothetical protein